MPLVDYASSEEESENEYEGDKKDVLQSNISHLKSNARSMTVTERNPNSDTHGQLFSSLPKPKKTFFFPEDHKLSKLLLNKNGLNAGKKEGVQISVPSISEFDDDSEQPVAKKIKPSAKGTGLFSILPPPKYNTSLNESTKRLVPHAVTKNHVKETMQKAGTNNKDVNSASWKGTDDDEDDDDAPVGSSFFGSSLEQQNSHLDSTDLSSQNISAVDSASKLEADPRNSFEKEINTAEQKCTLGLCLNVEEDSSNSHMNSEKTVETVSASDNPLELDEKALQILCGNKKKRQQMPMNIIDLSGEEILPDSKEWLLKQFTEEKRGRSHSHKKTHGPSSQSRRKHQITYLAYQAKEQELELQNQWANNRMSRKQTQSKYGF